MSWQRNLFTCDYPRSDVSYCLKYFVPEMRTLSLSVIYIYLKLIFLLQLFYILLQNV